MQQAHVRTSIVYNNQTPDNSAKLAHLSQSITSLDCGPRIFCTVKSEINAVFGRVLNALGVAALLIKFGNLLTNGTPAREGKRL